MSEVYYLQLDAKERIKRHIKVYNLVPNENPNLKYETEKTYRGIANGRPTQVLKEDLLKVRQKGTLMDLLLLNGNYKLSTFCEEKDKEIGKKALIDLFEIELENLNKIINNFIDGA